MPTAMVRPRLGSTPLKKKPLKLPEFLLLNLERESNVSRNAPVAIVAEQHVEIRTRI